MGPRLGGRGTGGLGSDLLAPAGVEGLCPGLTWAPTVRAAPPALPCIADHSSGVQGLDRIRASSARWRAP